MAGFAITSVNRCELPITGDGEKKKAVSPSAVRAVFGGSRVAPSGKFRQRHYRKILIFFFRRFVAEMWRNNRKKKMMTKKLWPGVTKF